MSQPKLTQYKAMIFDVYGTLIDWETGIYEALLPILPKSWSRKEALLAFASIELDLQSQHPDMLYSDVLANSHAELQKRLIAQADGSTTEAPLTRTTSDASTSTAKDDNDDPHKAFARTIGTWAPFPDTVAALRKLSKHFKLVVLSNVDRASFSRTHKILSQPSGESPFTLILTAQDTGAYKPSTIGFEHALRLLKAEGVEKNDEVLSVAQSRQHDHVPANKLGLGSVWINRDGAFMGLDGERKTVKIGWEFKTLGELAGAVEQELVA